MSFDPKTHNTSNLYLDQTRVRTSVWMAHHITGVPQKEVSAIITLESGGFTFHANLSAGAAKCMIDMLNQHIEYIKQAEIELLALQTKAAA